MGVDAARKLLVMEDRYLKGWPENDDARCGLAPLEEVLTKRYDSDAHFAAYTCALERRHTNGSLARAGEAGVRMVAAVFDVDGPNHTRTPEWWEEEKLKLDALWERHGGFIYCTRGGYRIVFWLPKETPIQTEADAKAWTAQYLAWLNYLRRVFGIEADSKCKGWMWLFRVPHALRDGEVQEPEMFGDMASVWAPELEEGDYAEEVPGHESSNEGPSSATAATSGPTPDLRETAADLLAKHWPPPGQRLDARFALIGACIRSNWSQEAVTDFVCRVHAAIPARGDATDRELVQMISTAFARHAKGDTLMGWTRLAELLPAAIVKTARDWLSEDPNGAAEFVIRTTEATPPRPASGFIGIHARELSKPLPPVEYVVQHFGIARGRPSLFAGYGGLGKTVIAQALALHLASGRTECWGLPITPGAVWHFDYEMTREPLQRRYQRLAEGHGITLQDCDLHLCSMPDVYLSDQEAEDELCRATEGVTFAILDNLAAAVATANLKENEAGIRRYLDRLTRVTSKTGCAFLPLAHERKGSKGDGEESPLQRVRGSSAITDACGSVISVTAAKATGILTLAQTKASLRRQGGEINLIVRDVAGSLPARPGDDSPGMVIERIGETANKQAETQQQDAQKRAAVEELKKRIREIVPTDKHILKSAAETLVGGKNELRRLALAEMSMDGEMAEWVENRTKVVRRMVRTHGD